MTSEEGFSCVLTFMAKHSSEALNKQEELTTMFEQLIDVKFSAFPPTQDKQNSTAKSLNVDLHKKS